MSKYNGTFRCGHEGVIDIIGPTKDRQWKADYYFSGLCPKCQKEKEIKQREQENKKNREEALELGFPELEGTPKQVEWAITIRQNFYRHIFDHISKTRDKHFKGFKYGENKTITLEAISHIIDSLVKNNINAAYWIEHRENFMHYYIEDIVKLYDEMQIQALAADIQEDVQIEISEEKIRLTVKPASGTERQPGIVQLLLSDNILFAKYIKNDLFREIIKSFKFQWNGEAWYRKLNEFTGTASDRAAELGNKLLSEGFAVLFFDDTSKDKAIEGTYDPEIERWVKWNQEYNKFRLCWPRSNDRLYKLSKKLPGARWRNAAMEVSIEFYKEVLDFAETMGFAISEKSRRAIEEYKKIEGNYVDALIKNKEIKDIPMEDRLRQILIKTSVIEDLKDEA